MHGKAKNMQFGNKGEMSTTPFYCYSDRFTPAQRLFGYPNRVLQAIYTWSANQKPQHHRWLSIMLMKPWSLGRLG